MWALALWLGCGHTMEYIAPSCPSEVGPRLADDEPTPWGPTPAEIVAAQAGRATGSWVPVADELVDEAPIEAVLTYAVAPRGRALLHTQTGEGVTDIMDCAPRAWVTLPAEMTILSEPGFTWTAVGTLVAHEDGSGWFEADDIWTAPESVDEQFTALADATHCGSFGDPPDVVPHADAPDGGWSFRASVSAASEEVVCVGVLLDFHRSVAP